MEVIEIKKPEHALHAWENGLRSKDPASLVDEQLKSLIIEHLLSYQWTARAFYNVIEEQYPALNQDPDQQATRKHLMHILRLAMDAVEKERIEEKKRYQGVVLTM